MIHDDFETWIRERSSGCMEPSEIDELCKGDLDSESGEYTFLNVGVQAQWESWQYALAIQCKALTSGQVEKIRQPFHNALGRMDAYLKRLNAEWCRTPDSDTGEAQLAVARLMAASVCVEMLEEALEERTT